MAREEEMWNWAKKNIMKKIWNGEEEEEKYENRHENSRKMKSACEKKMKK